MYSEQRTSQRVDLCITVEYKYYEEGRVFHSLQGETVNISAGGMALRGDRPIPKGRKLLATLYLPGLEILTALQHAPHDKNQHNIPVMLFSEVVHCRPENHCGYISGLKFYEPEIHHIQRFRQFLNLHHADAPVVYSKPPAPETGEM